MKPRILIIGYGSTLRGDDAAGPAVAERLSVRLAERDDVRVRVEASLTPELASEVAEAERVIFIDCAADLPPGRVAEFPVVAEGDGSPAMVHFLNAAALLRWARDLYGVRPAAVQLAIGGGSFTVSDVLTPAVASACERAVARVCALVGSAGLDTEAARA